MTIAPQLQPLLATLLLVPFGEAREALTELRDAGWDRDRAVSLVSGPLLAGMGLVDDDPEDGSVPSDADLVVDLLELAFDANPSDGVDDPLDWVEARYHALPWPALVGLVEDMGLKGVATEQALHAVLELVHQALPLPPGVSAVVEQASRAAVRVGLRLIHQAAQADDGQRQQRRQLRRQRHAQRRRRRRPLRVAAQPQVLEVPAAPAAVGA